MDQIAGRKMQDRKIFITREVSDVAFSKGDVLETVQDVESSVC